MLRSSHLESAAKRLMAIVLVGRGCSGNGGPGLAHGARHLLRDSRETARAPPAKWRPARRPS